MSNTKYGPAQLPCTESIFAKNKIKHRDSRSGSGRPRPWVGGIVRNQGIYKGKLKDPHEAEAKLGQFRLPRRPRALSKNALFVWDQESWGCWWPRMLPVTKVFPETK